MSDSPADPHLDEHDTLPPSMDPAVADETVEPPRDFFGILKRLGPGLIIAGSIVGSGELIATTKTGAQAGILLLWLIIIGCLIKVFVQIELGRYTIGHGETTLAALDQVPGPRLRVNWIVWFWLLMMLLGIGQLGGIVGGVGQAAALAVPITGDYEEVTKRPSEKEIKQYLKWSPYLLSEWDYAVWAKRRKYIRENPGKPLPEFRGNGITGEAAWRRSMSTATNSMLLSLERVDKKLADELRSRADVLLTNRGDIPDAEMTALIDKANTIFLTATIKIRNTNEMQRPDNKGLLDTLEYAKDDESRQRRIRKGYSILGRRLRILDQEEEDDRVITVVKAIRNVDAKFIHGDEAEAKKKIIAEYLEPPTYDDKIWAAIVTIITALLLFRGRYQMIQNISTILVVGFTFITIGNVIALQMTPEWQISFSQFIDGLSFKLPEATDGVTPLATALATFGIIGVGASELIAYPYWCLEKGYAKYTGKRSDDENWARRARGWMKVMHYDAFASMIVYTLATIAFFVMGVAVLYNEGRDPDGMRMVSTLATAYVPVFGEYARWLFLIGAVAVLYSTFLVATAGNARMYTDAVKIYGLMDHNNQKHHDRALSTFSVILPFMCLAVFCSGANPVRMILLSGAMQALLLPMIGFGALYFRYTRTDGRIKPGPVWDTLLIVSFIGLFIAGSYGAYKQILKFF